MLKKKDGILELPSDSDLTFDADDVESEVFRFDDVLCCRISADAFDSFCNAGYVAWGVREAYSFLDERDYNLIAKGLELINWSDSVQYCARCGDKLHRATEISKKCEKCGSEYFPTLTPAIVVLVTRADGQALLVHAKNFVRPDMYALVAGFVETGETLEECVAREVMEETNLEIKNIKYFGSQSWPFPGQLMIGFTAEYTSGELKFADGELSKGGWFSRENTPELPTLPSLSRRIIDSWITEKVGKL